MYKVLLLLCLLFVAGCGDNNVVEKPTPTPSPLPTPTVADTIEALNIDNAIVRFDIIGDTPCYPYLIEDNNAYYCNLDDTIYYGNELTWGNPRIVQFFALAHEDGHSEDTTYGYYDKSVFEMEQFADCFGGVKIEKLYKGGYIDLIDLQQLKTFIDTLPPGDHGSPQQRYAAFAYGYVNGECRRFN